MREIIHSTRLSRVLEAPIDLVWAVAADTNRWDRCLGLNETRYSYDRADPADPRSRTRYGSTRVFGLRARWTEAGEWIEGRSMWGERRFVRPLATRAGYRFTVTPEGAGTRIDIEAYSAGRGAVAGAVSRYWRGRFRRALRRFLGAVERTLTSLGAGAATGRPPAAARARRLLLGARQDRLLAPVSPVAPAALAACGRRLAELPVAAAMRERLLAFAREAPDEDAREIRAFELADAWGVDRRELLGALLVATRAGLVDLVWLLNCPTCRLGAASAATLADVRGRVHCAECDIDFDVDFADNVEVLFRVAPAVRPVTHKLYCGGSPWFRPHVFAYLTLAPGEVRQLDTALPAGPILVRALGGGRRLSFDDGRDVGGIVVDDGGVRGEGGAGGGLRAENRGGRETVLLVERAGWGAAIVRGSVLVTMPDYLGLHGAEAPAAGHELQIGRLALAFVDVVASTELYERVGDARAFALVQEHFRAVNESVARHRGAVVKTLGDGVMLSFARAHEALAAGFELCAAAAELGRRSGTAFAVRVGVHEGPCYLVRADDRLDLFGTTVNIAARLEGEAAPGQVVMLAELLDDVDVRAVLAAERPTVQTLQSELRGLRGHYAVAVMDAERRDAA